MAAMGAGGDSSRAGRVTQKALSPRDREELRAWLEANPSVRGARERRFIQRALKRGECSQDDLGWLRDDEGIIARWAVAGVPSRRELVLLDFPWDGPWATPFRTMLRALNERFDPATCRLSLRPAELLGSVCPAGELARLRELLRTAGYRKQLADRVIELEAVGVFRGPKASPGGGLLPGQELDGTGGAAWLLDSETHADGSGIGAGLHRLGQLGARSVTMQLAPGMDPARLGLDTLESWRVRGQSESEEWVLDGASSKDPVD